MSDESIGQNAGRATVIYDQDCDFYRHQDGLMWGRFQTAAVVEGGILYFLYGTTEFAKIDKIERCLLVFIGSLLVLVLCLLSLKDGSDAGRHLKRIKQFEESQPLPLGRGRVGSGYWLMLILIGIVNLGNIVLVAKTCCG